MFPNYTKPFIFHFYKTLGVEPTRESPIRLGKAKGVTVCFLPKGTGSSEFLVGTATCAARENFCRKVGRQISEGRARVGLVVKAGSAQELKALATRFAEEAAVKAR